MRVQSFGSGTGRYVIRLVELNWPFLSRNAALHVQNRVGSPTKGNLTDAASISVPDQDQAI